MILSDRDIAHYIRKGTIINQEYIEEGKIQPASLDMTLGRQFKYLKGNQTLYFDREPEYKEIYAEAFMLPGKSFCLATTRERINLPHNMSAFVEGRSSIGRMGLFIQNAGWVDPGFKGQITLELFNSTHNPIELRAGRRICQLVFAELKSPALNPYNGKYQNQEGTVGSKINLDHEVKNRK